MTGNLSLYFDDRLGSVETYDPDIRMRGKLRLALILVGTMTIGMGAAGGLIPIGGAVIGGGQMGVQSGVKKIAHPLGGTVAAILVENGQHVRKGQLMVKLDDKVNAADASFAALTVDQLLAQKARLEAERLGAGQIAFPDALSRRTDAAALKAMADEQKMLAIRRTEQAGIVSQLQARIVQYGQQIAGYRAQISSIAQQSALIEPERDGVRKLYEKRLVTLNRLNQLERTAVDLGGSSAALSARIAETEARIAETREQMIQLGETRRSEAGTQLAQINDRLNQQQAQSISAMDARDRTAIRAPYDGVVEKLAVQTIGGVVRPGDVIMEIVPDHDMMLVEGAISPTDIDQVHAGQSARVRFSSLNGAGMPEISGRITYVASEKATDPDGTHSHYPIRIELDRANLKGHKGLALKSGMPAEIFIETGSRSMLSYLTRPLRDQLARAFRDH